MLNDSVQVTICYDTGIQLTQDLLVDLCHIHGGGGGEETICSCCVELLKQGYSQVLLMCMCKHSGQFILLKMSPTQPDKLAISVESMLKWLYCMCR